MKEKINNYEIQISQFQNDLQNELTKSEIKWTKVLNDQRIILESQCSKLKKELDGRSQELSQLNKQNHEFMDQIDLLTQIVNDLKTEKNNE